RRSWSSRSRITSSSAGSRRSWPRSQRRTTLQCDCIRSPWAAGGSLPRCSRTFSSARASCRNNSRHASAPRLPRAMNHEVMSMSEVAQVERLLPVITRSDEWYVRATGLIPAHTQTLAKGPGQYVTGVAPKYLQRGKGSHVWDVDGNEFIDFSMAIGPLSLGYGYPAVDRAIREQLEDGITFSMMHPLEVEVAELIREVV